MPEKLRKSADKTFKSLPEEVKDYEAYKDAGFKKGGKVSSASKRADGCAIRGKTRA
jgi:general stress protein YciG